MNKNLSIIDFNKLNKHEQYELVFTKGDFIDYFLKKTTRYALYSLYIFFVEIEYDVTNNKILNLEAFEEGKLLVLADLK